MKNLNYCKYVFLCLFFSIAAINLSAQTWEKVPNSGNFINRIYTPVNHPDKVIVSSNLDSLVLDKLILFDGLIFPEGILVSNDSGKTFPNKYLDSMTVFDVFNPYFSPNKYFASVRLFGEGKIVKSEDGGETWDIENALSFGSNQPCKIAEDTASPNIFAFSVMNTDDGFNITTDDFQSYTPNTNLDMRSKYISTSKKIPGLMFIAGDSYYSDGVWRSLDSGKTWEKYESGLERLRVHTVMASSADPALVFCGVDTVLILSQKYYQGRGIYASLDTGRTWFPVGANNYRVFEIAEHPQYPNHIAAACDLGGVFVSSATGFYWEQMNTGLPENIPVRNIAIPNWEVTEAGFICFAGTEGQGVYKSQRVITSVEDKNISVKTVYPNPATDRISLSLNFNEISQVKINLYDVLGNLTAELYNSVPSSSEFNQTLQLPSELSEGCYFISINSGNSTKRIPLIIKK